MVRLLVSQVLWREMLNASDEAGLELFTKLFNNIVQEEKVPSDWEMSIICCYMQMIWC